MTSDSQSSASYAYYSFPPTPNRSSPPHSSSSGSKTPSPQTAHSSQSMAPSPAAGKAPANPPKTPTKSGKNPSSSATSKLGQSQSAADSPKNTAKSATNTPKGVADKAKASAPGKSDTSSPSLPPRPKDAGGVASKAKGATPKAPKAEEAVEDVKDKGDEAKGKVEDVKDKAEDTKEDTESKIDLKDNDPANEADNEETDTPGGKISQRGNETGAEEESSAASTADDLEEAAPEPVDDDDEATAGAEDTPEDETDVPPTDDAKGKADDVAKGTKDKVGDAKGKTDDVAKGAKSKAGDAKGKTDDVTKGAKGKAGGATDKADSVKGKAGGVKDKIGGAAGGLAGKASGAKDTAAKAGKGDTSGAAEDAKGGLEDTAAGAKEGAEDAAEDAKEGVEDAADDAQEDVEDAKDGVEDAADDVKDDVGDAKEAAEDGVPDGVDDAVEDAEDAAPDVDGVEDAVDDAKDTADDAAPDVNGVEDAVDDVKDTADDAATDVDGVEDAVDDVKDTAEDAAEDAADQVPVDLSVLKGLEVGEGGEILGPDGEPLGQIDEGDPEDLVGKTIGDDGEILDEDGDVIGRASVLPDKAKELADQAKDDLPDIAVLDGLEVGEDGNILGADGTPLGKIVDGDPKDLVGLKLNEKGEIVDADGDIVGRAEVVPGEAAEKLGEAEGEVEGALPDVNVLEGLKVGEGGEVLGDEDKQLGKIVEGDLEDLIGQEINEKGEILNEEGDVIGKVEVVPGEAADKLNETKEIDGLNDDLKPDFSILDGKKINKKGNILDDDGEIIGKLTEDSDLKQCVGKKPNEDGEILNDDGEVVGKVEVVAGEAADEAMRELNPEIVEKLEKAVEAAEERAAEVAKPDLSILDGLKVNKKGEVLNEDGEPIGRLVEGEIKDAAGKKINDNGEVLDKDGNVIGRVEVIPQEAEAAAEDAEGAAEDAEAAAEDAQGAAEEAKSTLPDLSILDGLKVNKKGEVVNEDGDPIARVSEGEVTDLAGKKINDKGEVLDSEGNVVGKVELIPQEPEDAEPEDAAPELPPLSILEGLTCNKSGKIVNENGKPVGELIEGDPKQLSKSGIECDAEGQFWDSKGHVIGRAQTLPQDDDEEEATFAGLEGLIVVKDGFVEDINENKVGIITEGDPKKLVGRTVDEDGDVLDKRGNVVGHAERYEEPEDTGPELPPLSILEGLKCNKSGKIVNSEGKAVGELIEGDPKKISQSGALADAEGQFWDTKGNVVGKAQTLPQSDEDEEGTFAGLEGLIVVKDGYVEDINENRVGILTEGDPKKLVGRTVDEDGDVLDKRGNVVGHAERYEEPEDTGPQLPPLSILEGLKCNKSGKIVNSEGKAVGELIEGDPKKISKSGALADAEGQFWDTKGNVVGKAQTLPQSDEDEEGSFAGLEGLVVVKDGFVEDINENKVGIITEGDPNKLVGRAVDEDGDVLDKRGNVVGHAERYQEPEPEEEQKPDLSILKGLTINKQGNVIGLDGVPIARVVEGNVKELSGRKCDEEGQVWNDAGKVIGRCELIPDNEREAKPEGPFAGLEGLVVVKGGMVEDEDGNTVGQVVEGDPKKLVGRGVDEDGDIIDKYGNVKGHAEPYDEPDVEEADLSSLEGKVVNKAGNVVDEHGTIYGRVVSGDTLKLAGRKVDGQGQIWSDNGKVIGQAELIPGGDRGKADGPFAGFEGLIVVKDGFVQDGSGQVVGKLAEGSDPVKLLGRKVDEDGDILDSSGNTIGKAERYTPEEKERKISPMSGRKVNKEGEVRDEDGNVIGKLTEGDLASLIGCEIDDNGYVIDNDGNRIGQCTLLENIKEEEPEPEEEEEGPSEEELAAMKKAEEDNELAKKMNSILKQTLDRIEPICKQITERIEVADRTPKDELDEEQLVQDVKPLIEEGGRILQECNGAIRGLDPDGRIAANAKARAANREATPEEYALADSLKELTTTVVKTIDNAKKKIADMPHAKKGLNPLWGLLTEPLFQIIAAVGLLLAGVLGLVGKLLNGLGLGGLVNGLLGGLGIDKLLGGLGLGSITEALGFGGKKKKK